MKKTIFLKSIIIICGIAVLIAVINVLSTDRNEGKFYVSQESTEMLNETTKQVIAETTQTESEYIYNSPINFEALLKVNPDTVGWIQMEGTKINYPIVQAADNDFYLQTDFDGNKSKYGAIYLDYESDADLAGRNNIIYGHNMKNGSMFKDIVKFKDEAFFKKNQFFKIYTPERTIHLKAVACYYGKADPIARRTKFANQESFNDFVDDMLAPCGYAEPPNESIESLYVFITCSYEIDDARTFLFAVEVDENQQLIAIDSRE